LNVLNKNRKFKFVQWKKVSFWKINNKFNKDIRLHFYDDLKQKKSLLCYASSQRSYKLTSKYILLGDKELYPSDEYKLDVDSKCLEIYDKTTTKEKRWADIMDEEVENKNIESRISESRNNEKISESKNLERFNYIKKKEEKKERLNLFAKIMEILEYCEDNNLEFDYRVSNKNGKILFQNG